MYKKYIQKVSSKNKTLKYKLFTGRCVANEESVNVYIKRRIQ